MTSKRSEPGPEATRREFAWMTLGMLSLAMGGTILPSRARAEHHATKAPILVTGVESNKLMLSQVQFVPVSEREGERCENCTMLWARDGGYGSCALFQQGKVPVTAWCTSWTRKWE